MNGMDQTEWAKNTGRIVFVMDLCGKLYILAWLEVVYNDLKWFKIDQRSQQI